MRAFAEKHIETNFYDTKILALVWNKQNYSIGSGFKYYQ